MLSWVKISSRVKKHITPCLNAEYLKLFMQWRPSVNPASGAWGVTQPCRHQLRTLGWAELLSGLHQLHWLHIQGQQWDPEAQWAHFSCPRGPLPSVVWDDPGYLSFASPWSVSQSSKLLHHFSTCCPVKVRALQSSFNLKDLKWASWTTKSKPSFW